LFGVKARDILMAVVFKGHKERTRRPIPSKPMKKMELKKHYKKNCRRYNENATIPQWETVLTTRGGQQHLRDFQFPSVP
jgi:hypothetical protein